MINKEKLLIHYQDDQARVHTKWKVSEPTKRILVNNQIVNNNYVLKIGDEIFIKNRSSNKSNSKIMAKDLLVIWNQLLLF
jgi:sporulation protein YlmC with PRC-barrel domain